MHLELIIKIKYLLFFLFFAVSLSAQNFFSFNEWNPSLDLPKGNFYAMEQDDLGFMWLAMSTGLYRFDGLNFELCDFETEENCFLPEGTFNKLFKDKNGHIWAGTLESGLYELDPKIESVRCYFSIKGDSLSLPDSRIKAILEDGKGRLWVGCHKEGWCLLDKEKRTFKQYKPAEILGRKTNDRALNDPTTFHYSEPYLWVGTLDKLIRFHPETEETKYYDFCANQPVFDENGEQKPITGLLDIFEDSDGKFWITTYLREPYIFVFDPKTGDCEKLETPTLTGRNYTSFNIIPYSDSVIWVSKFRDGILSVNTKTKDCEIIQKSQHNSNLDLMTYRLFKDDSGRIWGFHHEKLFLLDEGNPKIEKTGMPLPIARIKSSADGKKWFLAADFMRTFLIYDVDKNIFQNVDYQPIRDKGAINQIGGFGFLKNGNLIANDNTDLFIWNGKTTHFEPYIKLTLPEGREHLGGLHQGFLDSRENYWAGTKTNGFFKINIESKEVTLFRNEPESDKNPIVYNGYTRIFYEDSKGRIWYGTERGFGYFDYEKNAFVNFPPEDYETDNPAVPLKHIYAITEDQKGNIWIGSDRKGVGYFDPNVNGKLTVRTFSQESGMRGDKIEKLITDSEGNIWISTNAGISKIDGKNHSIQNFGKEYGISGSPSPAVSPNGKVLVANGNHILSFYPDDLKLKNNPPKIILSKFKIFDKKYPFSQNLNENIPLTLGYEQNFFSFEFTALNFFNPEQTVFSCQLEGLDEAWNEIGKRQSASYTNVPGGNYIFKVRAKTEGGDWGEITALKLKIIPPFWKTGWFIFFISLLTAAIIVGIYSYNIRQIREKEALKSAFNQQLAEVEMTALRAQMNPHFLFNCLNSIKLFIVENETEAASEYLTKFSRLIRLILHNSKSKMVRLSDELEALRLYIEMEKMRFDNQFEYEIKIENNVQTDSVEIPPLLLQPYVENAIWHGLVHENQPNILQILVRQNNGVLNCIIEDNGIGRTAAANRKKHQNARKRSLGMSITKNRIDLANQLYRIETGLQIVDLRNEKGEPAGTRVEISIPTS